MPNPITTFTSSSDNIKIHELDIYNYANSHLDTELPLQPLPGVSLGLPATEIFLIGLEAEPNLP